jgi:hypothetical protein
MQGQGDERRILRVHVPAQAASLHPGADGDAAFFNEMDPGEKFVEAFQQILFAQFRGLGDPLLMPEKLDEDEAWAVECGCAVGQKSLAQAVSPRSSREKRMLVSTTMLAGFTRLPRE